MKLILLIITALLAACSNESSLPTAPPPEGSTKQLLVWSDEFDTEGTPDPAKWELVHGQLYWNNSLEYYTLSGNAHVSEGTLKITARHESSHGAEYTSALLSSRDLASWTYGRIEVRAKIPSGRGIHPAIWLKPQVERFGDNFMSGEIDIMEHYGFINDTIHAAVQTGAANFKLGNGPGGTLYVPDIESTFHTYALEWSKDSLLFYVDSSCYFTYHNSGKGVEEWPFDYPFFIYLNVAVGGDWAGSKGVDKDSFPQTMEIDYVRVYNTVPKESTYSFTTTPAFHGTIQLSETGPYLADQTVILTALPESGYEFVSWQGTVNGTENPKSVRIKQNHTVSALFQRIGNSAKNADFQFGFRDWNIYTLSDTVDQLIHTASADSTAFCDSVKIVVTDGGLNLWSVMLVQERLPVEAGKKYQVLFTAKADRPCTIRAKLQNRRDYSEYGGISAALTEEKKSFTFPVTVSADDENASLLFDLGVDSTEFTFYEVNLITVR